jgi:uncharacterized membrane protein YdjX (TVP38/TMEM64 family)
VILAALFITARYFNLGGRIAQLRSFIDQLGPLGMLVYGGIYMAATVAMIPGAAITVIAGTLFGSIWGVALVSISSTLGASISFLLARYFARDSIADWLSDNRAFKRLDKLTEVHGPIIVALTRLVPLFPFNILNYGFGLTRVRFIDFLFWSWLCMLPGTAMYVVGADTVTRAIQNRQIPWPFVIALTVIIAILAAVVKIASRLMREKQQETP